MGAGYCRSCHSIRSTLLHAADWLLTKAAGMQTFETLQPFTLSGRELQAGQSIQLTPLQATQCINLGLVKPQDTKASLVILDEFAFHPPAAEQVKQAADQPAPSTVKLKSRARD